MRVAELEFIGKLYQVKLVASTLHGFSGHKLGVCTKVLLIVGFNPKEAPPAFERLGARDHSPSRTL